MRHSELLIRAYDQATDLHALSSIWFEASLRAHAFIGEKRLGEQRILIEEEYLPNSETWVACLRGSPVGFISLLDHFVGGLFVAPDQQGMGVGRALVAHALSLRGKLELEVYTANAQAVRFYEGLGFLEEFRRSEDDEGQPFENAHMRLDR